MRPAQSGRWIVLAALGAGAAWGAPSYTAAGIVNAGNYAPGPFAPNSILTIFGSGLARSSQGLTAADIQGGLLPTELNYTRVYVDNYPAPLFYVSDGQINFLVPGNQVGRGSGDPGRDAGQLRARGNGDDRRRGAGAVRYRRRLRASPPTPTIRWSRATRPPARTRSSWSTRPAWGRRRPTPHRRTSAVRRADHRPGRVEGDDRRCRGEPPTGSSTPGLTPGSAGLYQINLAVPDSAGTDPEIRVAVGAQTSAVWTKTGTPLNRTATLSRRRTLNN